jgi:hypothetical protein
MAYEINIERTSVKGQCEWLGLSEGSVYDVTWQRLWLYGKNLWQTECEY